MSEVMSDAEAINYSMGMNLIIKLMSDAEKRFIEGAAKKSFVLREIKLLMPDFYVHHDVMIGVFVDSIVYVAANPTMVQNAAVCGRLCHDLCNNKSG